MESLYFLIPLSLVTFGVAIWALFWAVNSGQYEDVDREGERILFDEDISAQEQDADENGSDGEEGQNNGVR